MKSVDTWLRETFTEHRFQKAERIRRSKKLMDAAILMLAGLSVMLFVYEISTPSTHPWINLLSVCLDVVFLFDYILRLYYSGSQGSDGFRWRKASTHYVYRWYGVVDWIAVFPPILTHVFHIGLGLDEFSRLSRFLRIARMTRVLRVLRTFRLVQASERLSSSLQAYHKKLSRELAASMLFVLAAMVIGVLGIYYFEQGTGSEYQDFDDTVYWSILSVMGQADGGGFTTWYSRTVAVALIFIGVAFFGIVAGSITTFFMDNMSKHMQGREKWEGKNHVVICGWNSKIPELMQHLRKVSEIEVVILLFDRGNTEEDISGLDRLQNPHTGQYISAYWIRGNPRNTEDLKRANVLEARSVIVLADYSKTNLDEDDIDARSLMTLEMINEIGHEARWLSDANTSSHKKAEVTVELLTVQAIFLARKYADHVVYADDLICQYITLDTQSREAGQVYERLIDPTDQNVYLVDIENLENYEPSKYIDSLEAAFRKYQSLFMGIFIGDDIFISLALGSREFYDLLVRSDLLESGEELMKTQYGISLLRFVENPPQHLERRNGSTKGVAILNPIARRDIVDHILSHCNAVSYPAGNLKAIGMSSSYPQGLEL